MARDTIKFTAKTGESGLDAAEIVVKRAKALCFSRNQDPSKLEHYTPAVIEVLKADKGLGTAYKELLTAEQIEEMSE